MKKDYKEVDKMIKDMEKILNAANKAFKEAGIEYGDVNFKCPLCGGTFKVSKRYTPKLFHKITVRGKCEKCGYMYMN